MNIKVQKFLSIALPIISGIGVAGAMILTAKETQKAEKRIDNMKKVKGDEAKKIDYVKAALPAYIPAISIGAITVASIIGSSILSRKQEASLIATCTLLDQGYKKYKNKIKEAIGVDKEKDILTEIMKDEYKDVAQVPEEDNKRLYWEEHIGYFRANPETFAWATSNLNQRLNLVDYMSETPSFSATLKDLIDYSDAELEDTSKLAGIANIGWSMDYLVDVFEYNWIHFYLDEVTMDDGMQCYKVSYGEDPICAPWDFAELSYEEREGLLYPSINDAQKFIPEEEDILNEKSTRIY